MEIIPAIDLKGGSCVRLRQGKENEVREYSADPVAVAHSWVSQGARRLHVVNLDGAFGRASDNLAILREIAGEGTAKVQYGGGLRTHESIADAFASGADKVVLGTVALSGDGMLGDIIRRYGAQRVIVALDAVEGRLAVKGWTEVTGRNVEEAAAALQEAGVQEILYTDIHRDGMMTGPDLRTLEELSNHGLDILASGGISSADDVRAIIRLGRENIKGVIIGKALYEGVVSLTELLSVGRASI
jgi:phosphoribosylformimino-5-aminoimidazole carboxamide ribotide isomerase